MKSPNIFKNWKMKWAEHLWRGWQFERGLLSGNWNAKWRGK
jgi:hypothetical protein